MKRTIGVLALIFAVLAPSLATATQSWLYIGDSIASRVPQGTASQLAMNLVGAERDVIFKSIASPGAVLGRTDYAGFNNATTLAIIDQVKGVNNGLNGIIVQPGTNDFYTSISPADTYASLKNIIAKAKALSLKVLVLEPIWRADEVTPNARNLTLNTYRYYMATACNEEPGTCRFASRFNTMMGTNAGAPYYDSTEVANNAQIHPNAIGQRAIADWIKAEAAAAGFF